MVLINESGSCMRSNFAALPLTFHLQLVSRQEGKLAFSTCLEVLRKLGEEISTTSASDAHVMELQKRLRQITDKYGEITESDLLKMKEMTSPNHLRLMHFYNHLVFISYFLKNMKIVKECSCRLLELTLEHGVSKHSTTSLARYAMTLPTKEGYRIGKMAISLLQRFDATDQIPSVYLCFYGYIAIYIEPLQVSENFVFSLLPFWLFRVFLQRHTSFSFVFRSSHVLKCE